MMSVEAPQQVMLEVKVAEVSKTLINQMGAALNLNGSFGSWTFGALANFLSGAPTSSPPTRPTSCPSSSGSMRRRATAWSRCWPSPT